MGRGGSCFYILRLAWCLKSRPSDFNWGLVRPEVVSGVRRSSRAGLERRGGSLNEQLQFDKRFRPVEKACFSRDLFGIWPVQIVSQQPMDRRASPNRAGEEKPVKIRLLTGSRLYRFGLVQCGFGRRLSRQPQGFRASNWDARRAPYAAPRIPTMVDPGAMYVQFAIARLGRMLTVCP